MKAGASGIQGLVMAALIGVAATCVAETTGERIERHARKDVRRAKEKERTHCPKRHCGDNIHRNRLKVGKNVSVGVDPAEKQVNIRISR